MIWPWILLKPSKSLARSFRITGSGYYFSSSPVTPDRPAARSRALAIAPCRFSYLCWNLTIMDIRDALEEHQRENVGLEVRGVHRPPQDIRRFPKVGLKGAEGDFRGGGHRIRLRETFTNVIKIRFGGKVSDYLRIPEGVRCAARTRVRSGCDR